MTDWADTALFSKGSDEWRTPKWLFDLLDKEFNFDLDVACTRDNCLSRNGYGFSKYDDALKIEWNNFTMGNGEYANTFFMNPPHSQIGDFVFKAMLETTFHNMIGVLLIPARTDTHYWHSYVMPVASEIRFIKGRLKFESDFAGKKITGAPFPSCVVIMDHKERDAKHGVRISSLLQAKAGELK